MIKSFRSKTLRRFWVGNDPKGIRPDWVKKVRSFLVRLDAAERPEDLDTPGSGFHALTSDLAGRYALAVSRNWRLTFAFERQGAVDLDLEDYHG